MTDLSLAAEADIINELIKRYDHISISGIRFTNKVGEYVTLRRTSGSRHMIISQLEITKQVLVKEEIESVVPIKGLDR